MLVATMESGAMVAPTIDGVVHLFPFEQEMAAADFAVLVGLVAGMAEHDREIADHAGRMIPLAAEVALRLGLAPTEVLHTCLAALLHDIGKRNIPNAILHKPGSLDADEWALMRLHTVMGYQMLSEQGSIFTQVAPYVLAHHERWDGMGYPLCLMQEEIPLIARILAVVDSYDAMTSVRPYKPARTPAQTCIELQRCAGTQFDPHVVEVALPVLRELCEIRGFPFCLL
jgi:HD-GYP domain-containing protein (c-di-GMP phosphodiesterase class II)